MENICMLRKFLILSHQGEFYAHNPTVRVVMQRLNIGFCVTIGESTHYLMGFIEGKSQVCGSHDAELLRERPPMQREWNILKAARNSNAQIRGPPLEKIGENPHGVL